MDFQRHFAERRAKLEVGGRIVDGIPAETHQESDLFGLHRLDETFQRFGSHRKTWGNRSDVTHTLADRFQVSVDGVGKCVDVRRLPRSGDNQATSVGRRAVIGQIVDECFEPVRGRQSRPTLAVRHRARRAARRRVAARAATLSGVSGSR